MSQTNVKPYLFFKDRCEEALKFYQESVGAEVDTLMRFKDSPVEISAGSNPEGFGEKVMHASFRVGGSTIMACDGGEAGQEFSGFSLAVSAATEAEVKQMFDALADGGTVTMPLEKTFWSALFGMLTDRFGVSWMVMVDTGGR